MVDNDEPDQKIVAVPHHDPRYEQVKTASDIPPHVQREIEHFFSVYKELEGKKPDPRLGSFEGSARIIRDSRRRYLEKKSARWRK